MPGMLRKSAAFVPRYQKFESISLQQRVRKLSVPGALRLFRHRRKPRGTPPRSGVCGCTARISRGFGVTVEPKTHIRRCDESAKCSVKSARSAQRFLNMHAAVHNTFNLRPISSHARRCESFEWRRPTNCGMRSRLCDRAFRLCSFCSTEVNLTISPVSAPAPPPVPTPAQPLGRQPRLG